MKQDKTIAQIAKEHNRTYQRIHQILHDNGFLREGADWYRAGEITLIRPRGQRKIALFFEGMKEKI